MSAAGKSAGKGAGKAASLSRSRARLAAVQALYQMDMAETDLGAVLEEFSAHPLVDEAEGDGLGKPDVEHMTRVLKGVVARQREIDPLIDNQLATGWRLVRIDSIVRAILRAAAFTYVAAAAMSLLDVMRWKEIYGRLENAADQCEDVANTIESIVIKSR